MTTCAFTGHRPEKFPFAGDETTPHISALKQLIFHQVERLYKQRAVTQFLTGGAIGVDYAKL